MARAQKNLMFILPVLRPN